MPGNLPSFYTGIHPLFFPETKDEVVADVHMRTLTDAYRSAVDRMMERYYEMEKASGERGIISDAGLPKVTWNDIHAFPFNEPKSFLEMKDFLDAVLPIKFSNAEWDFPSKVCVNERNSQYPAAYLRNFARQGKSME